MGWLVLLGVCVVALIIYRSIIGRSSSSRIPCPACREQIVVGAQICPFCRLQFTDGQPRAYMQQAIYDYEDNTRRARIINTVVVVACLAVLAIAILIIVRAR